MSCLRQTLMKLIHVESRLINVKPGYCSNILKLRNKVEITKDHKINTYNSITGLE